MVPREFARLMGVADHLPVPTSEQAANRLYGNAVAVAVVESVVQSMVVALSGEGGDGVGNVVTPID